MKTLTDQHRHRHCFAEGLGAAAAFTVRRKTKEI